MKRFVMLLLILATVASTTAFASNENDGKNDGTKVELSTPVKSQAVQLISELTIEQGKVLPSFNLTVMALPVEVSQTGIELAQEYCSNSWEYVGMVSYGGHSYARYRRLCVTAGPTAFPYYEYRDDVTPY